MYLAVFRELDRIFKAVRPRKLVFMALDGVAPRAKQNQQRSRRFKAAREAKEAEEDKEKLRNDFLKMGKVPPPRKRLAGIIRITREQRLWISKYCGSTYIRGLRTILHGRTSRSYGFKYTREVWHKIMEFIRLQRVKLKRIQTFSTLFTD